tara:strand:+ start:262 stop:579 length:318 start_codon:yes stop_codon:yes gene_type:complete
MSRLNIELSDEFHEHLRSVARGKDVSVSALVKVLLSDKYPIRVVLAPVEVVEAANDYEDRIRNTCDYDVLEALGIEIRYDKGLDKDESKRLYGLYAARCQSLAQL